MIYLCFYFTYGYRFFRWRHLAKEWAWTTSIIKFLSLLYSTVSPKFLNFEESLYFPHQFHFSYSTIKLLTPSLNFPPSSIFPTSPSFQQYHLSYSTIFPTTPYFLQHHLSQSSISLFKPWVCFLSQLLQYPSHTITILCTPATCFPKDNQPPHIITILSKLAPFFQQHHWPSHTITILHKSVPSFPQHHRHSRTITSYTILPTPAPSFPQHLQPSHVITILFTRVPSFPQHYQPSYIMTVLLTPPQSSPNHHHPFYVSKSSQKKTLLRYFINQWFNMTTKSSHFNQCALSNECL